ncbi:trypsin-like peptidase domain-containing protein [candidate division KSB1 bacterium]|nr:trypsin-like peptidase domain-containing protein [candidate division KSB1 bacterium]
MRTRQIHIFFCFTLFVCTVHANAISDESVLNKMQQEISELIEIAKPSVVTISTKTSRSYTVSKDNGIFSIFASEEEKTVSDKTICTGLIYNEDGYIVTKNRDVKDSDEITVTLYDGMTLQPEYIGHDPQTGISVLKINPQHLVAPKFKRDTRVEAGEWVFVIGNSMGCSASISLGLVNGFVKRDMFQFSAMLSPGNGGSPIFDIEGNVVGILMFKMESSPTHQGDNVPTMFSNVGLALPIDRVHEMMDELIHAHENNTGWLGVRIRSDSTNSNRIIVDRVIPNTPAQKYGLIEGDVLVTYNNSTIQDMEHLGKLISGTVPGSVVPISIIRQNNKLNVFVEIGKKKQVSIDTDRSRNKKPDVPRASHRSGKQNSWTNDYSGNDANKLHDRVKNLENELQQLKNKLNKRQSN